MCNVNWYWDNSFPVQLCKMYGFLKMCMLFITLKKATLSECVDEAIFCKHVGKYLAGNVFRIEKVQSESECSMYCLRYRSCLSANYKITGKHKGKCELNSKVLKDLSSKKNMHHSEYVHLEKVRRIVVTYEQQHHCYKCIIFKVM